MKNFLNKLKKEEGYTLIELLLTILIVSIILIAVTGMLIQIIRISQTADRRRVARQDLELSLEVLRRDLRNADPAMSLIDCDPASKYDLKAEKGNTLDLVLSNGLENVKYSLKKDSKEDYYSLVREYKGVSDSTFYLTSDEVNVTNFKVSCGKLLKSNKFLLIEVTASSTQSGKNGKIVDEVKRYTGVTIRNTSN